VRSLFLAARFSKVAVSRERVNGINGDTRSPPPATTLFGPMDEMPVFHQNLKHKSGCPIEFLSDQERIRAGFLDDMT
jgi:hypothetical protein